MSSASPLASTAPNWATTATCSRQNARYISSGSGAERLARAGPASLFARTQLNASSPTAMAAISVNRSGACRYPTGQPEDTEHLVLLRELTFPPALNQNSWAAIQLVGTGQDAPDPMARKSASTSCGSLAFAAA